MSPIATARYSPKIPLGLYKIMVSNSTNKMAEIAEYIPTEPDKEPWMTNINEATIIKRLEDIYQHHHPRHALPEWVSPTIAFLAGAMFLMAMIYIIYNIHRFVKKRKKEDTPHEETKIKNIIKDPVYEELF